MIVTLGHADFKVNFQLVSFALALEKNRERLRNW